MPLTYLNFFTKNLFFRSSLTPLFMLRVAMLCYLIQWLFMNFCSQLYMNRGGWNGTWIGKWFLYICVYIYCIFHFLYGTDIRIPTPCSDACCKRRLNPCRRRCSENSFLAIMQAYHPTSLFCGELVAHCAAIHNDILCTSLFFFHFGTHHPQC